MSNAVGIVKDQSAVTEGAIELNNVLLELA